MGTLSFSGLSARCLGRLLVRPRAASFSGRLSSDRQYVTVCGCDLRLGVWVKCSMVARLFGTATPRAVVAAAASGCALQ